MDEILENVGTIEEEPEEMETIETEEIEEDNSNSLKALAIGVLAIGGAVTAVTLFVKKHSEKWAKKYLEKKGYEVTLPADAEDEPNEEEESEDSEEK